MSRPTNATNPETLLLRARTGDDEALGGLLEVYRNYFRLLARSLLGPGLRIRLDPSDLVQETFLKAHREFATFAGSGEPELVAWLRQILVRTLVDLARHHRRQARDHRREESLQSRLDRSCAETERALASFSSAPGARVMRREQATLLADAVEQLPADYREVFVLRTLEHLPFAEISRRMGRSVGAVQMLWARALTRLGMMLEGLS